MDGRRIERTATIRDEGGSYVFFGSPWRIAVTNDFNQDGWSDILWHRSDSGVAEIWYMQGTSILRREEMEVTDGEEGAAVIKAPWKIMRQ
jgi:hypothetical protein